MSSDSPEATGTTETAVFEVMIRGSIDDVWHELTKTDELQGAIFNGRLHTTGLEAGGAIQMRTATGKYTSIVGHIIEFAPPHRFVHTMAFTAYDDPASVVEYDLEAVGQEVRLRLTVTMTPGTKSTKQMKQGGTMIVNTLKRIVETGRPSLGIRMLYVLFKVMEPISPKRCRADKWPMQAESKP